MEFVDVDGDALDDLDPGVVEAAQGRDDEAEDHWQLWRAAGAMLGIREDLLPADVLSATAASVSCAPGSSSAFPDAKESFSSSWITTFVLSLALSSYSKQKDAAWFQRQRDKVDRGLAVMEKDLGKGEFCFGGRFTLADIAAGYALGYLDFAVADIEWRKGHPALTRLAERLFARPSFGTTAHAQRK